MIFAPAVLRVKGSASPSIPLRFCGAPQNRKYAPSIDMRSVFNCR